MGISFKPFHGTPYQKFLINRIYPNGKIKRIGKMLAPNLEMATLKARELWNTEPAGTTLMVETPEQSQARFMAKRSKKPRRPRRS